nr:MAG TPA: hypothetical protein [Caudoviricetes sp.]
MRKVTSSNNFKRKQRNGRIFSAVFFVTKTG